jgi:hypothetical protein
MNSSITSLLESLSGSEATSAEAVAFNLLVAFIVGQFNAWFYKWTHNGITYSRTFTQALILITLIATLSMMLIMTAPIAAFGLLGGMAIIRFRTVVRDARDSVYVLLCLVCGMAIGMNLPLLGVIGAVAANFIAWYLHGTGFGGWRSVDSVLRLQIDSNGYDKSSIQKLLNQFCRRTLLVSVDESPSMTPNGAGVLQCVFKLRLRNPEDGAMLVRTLRSSETVRFVNLLVDPEREEVN